MVHPTPQIRDFTLRIADFTLHVDDITLQIADFTLQVGEFTPPIGDLTLRIDDSTLQFDGRTPPSYGCRSSLTAAPRVSLVGWCGVLRCGISPANKKRHNPSRLSTAEECDFDCAFNLRALVPPIKATHRFSGGPRPSRTVGPQELGYANVAHKNGNAGKLSKFFPAAVLCPRLT